jgi:hypothetical protein
LSGSKVLPPGSQYESVNGIVDSGYDMSVDSSTVPPDDFQQCAGVSIVQLMSEDPKGLGFQNDADPIGYGSASIDDAVSSPSALSVRDGLIGALENGVGLGQLEVIFNTDPSKKEASPGVMPHDVWDQILAYQDAPTLTVVGDRPRQILSVDTSPANGDIAIDVDDPGEVMYDLAFSDDSDPQSVDYHIVPIRHSGGVNGRWQAISKSKDGSGGTTFELEADLDAGTKVGTPDIDDHSTAHLHLGRKVF